MSDRQPDRRLARLTPLAIAGLYAVVAVIWIAVSDSLVALRFPDPDAMARLQVMKGVLFVLVTAGLLYWLLNRWMSALRGSRAELAETRRAHDTLISNLPGLVYRCRLDRSWTMEFLSDGCRELTGYPPADLLDNQRLAYADLIHSDDREGVWRGVNRAVEAGEPFQLEYRIIDADGQEKHVWEQGRGVFDEDGTLRCLEGFIVDITERTRLEDELRQIQKMENLGRLAGSIAHDFNNTLTAIRGYCDLMLDDPEVGDRPRADLTEIQKATEHAKSLTAGLLAFSRRQESNPRQLDVNEVVRETRGMLDRLLGERIDLRTELDPEIGATVADPAHLQQVIVNLAVNARDAMPDGGRLRIESRNVRAAAEDVMAGFDLPAGEYVRLTVRDNGIGMARETRERALEPFFTTKEEGKGTGLGLSTVYGIVRQAGGALLLESEPGVGTSVHVYLPRVDLGERQAAS